jgi:hypothetical protein
MAHVDWRMKGHCKSCEQTMFIGVCPHGMAEYTPWCGLCESRHPAVDEEHNRKMAEVMKDYVKLHPEIEEMVKKSGLSRQDKV